MEISSSFINSMISDLRVAEESVGDTGKNRKETSRRMKELREFRSNYNKLNLKLTVLTEMNYYLSKNGETNEKYKIMNTIIRAIDREPQEWWDRITDKALSVIHDRFLRLHRDYEEMDKFKPMSKNDGNIYI